MLFRIPKSILDRNISLKPFIILFITFCSIRATMVDTTVFGDGGPGPYYLGLSFIDTATITISLPDSSFVPPWTFINTHNAILFSTPIDSGMAIHITFSTSFYGVQKVFSLYQKNYLDRYDTTGKLDTLEGVSPHVSRDENLNVAGYKSFGMSVGSFGQVNIEQGLDVRIGGELKPRTSVSAHLSDQGSSLDGTTREISDFDMIYLALKDPSYGAVAGDQFVAWPFMGLLSGQKKIKGLSATVSPEKSFFSVGAFGALSGGNTAIETKQGHTGVQGPYYLTGKGERDFIQPVGGTVKIRLNGSELEEGADRDFVVDYELGTVTFTPKRLIRNEDLIRLEYEYKLFNYQRTLVGTSAGAASADSGFLVQGVFWSESDNKNHPLDLTLSTQDIEALKTAGDRIPYASTARSVHPNDVARESQLYPLYKKSAVTGDSLFVYTPYDVAEPDSVTGYYYVWFRTLALGEQGRYRVAFSDQRGAIYDTCDTSVATHTDRSPLRAPAARRTGEIRTTITLPAFKASLNIAGQDNDRNLFSPIDDADNRASATAFSFFSGDRDIERPSVWLSGSHRFTSRRFDAEVVSAYDRKELWNDTRLAVDTTERQQWEATAGITPLRRLQASLTYGQERDDAALITDKFAPAALYSLWNKRLSLDYKGTFFRHPSRDIGGQREYGGVRLALPKNNLELLYHDEWRTDSLDLASGFLEGGFAWDFLPFHWRQKISYLSKRRRDPGRFRSIDTGYSARWEQSVDHAIVPSLWRLSGSSAFDRSFDRSAGRSMTTLIDLTSDVGRDGRSFSSRQHYRSSSEMASSFIQIPVFAGKGMGTHSYDTLRREYVPSTPGDYFLQQQEVYDSSSNARVRKSSVDISWSWEPEKNLKGILNDLSWQGTLFCEEHVDANALSPSSWVPGYRSIAAFFSDSENGDPVVRYADLSYRQEIDWTPRNDSARTATARVSITPSYRNIRTYREGGIEARVETDRTLNQWNLGGALHALSLNHNDTLISGADYTVRDYRIELTQRYRLPRNMTLSLLEAGGLAGKTAGTESAVALGFDSAFYYQIAPSLSWLPGKQGTVSAHYTWSVVPLPGDIDFRMARGFMAGTTHQASISTDIRMGERFLILGTYRGDWRKPVSVRGFDPANHLFSLEVRVFL
jgi:hypothetical protein